MRAKYFGLAWVKLSRRFIYIRFHGNIIKIIVLIVDSWYPWHEPRPAADDTVMLSKLPLFPSKLDLEIDVNGKYYIFLTDVITQTIASTLSTANWIDKCYSDI